jgi:glycosyltransferase involved in cell wall biosynthesis
MKEQGFEVYTASADGPEIPSFTEREGVPHKTFPLTRKITPFIDMRAVFAIKSWLKEIQPDIVHTHTPKAGLIGMMAATWAGVPHRLHTVAGMPLMEETGTKRRILEAAERVTYAFANRVYPNSYNLKDFIQQNIPVDQEKLKVIGQGSSNGIDTDYFSSSEYIRKEARTLRKGLRIGENDIVFCFVGRVVKDKGINELIRAFLDLKKEISNIHLVMVGPYEEDLDPVKRETRAAIEEDHHIHGVGFQSDIRPYLAMSDVFTFPSYREGFPNVVLQAACFELPLIVTDINGCNEIVEHDETGLIIPPKNEKALFETMYYLATESKHRKRLGEAARRLVVKNYSQAKVWQALLDEYNSLLHDLP